MHAGHRERSVFVDGLDERVRVRAAHERHVQQAGQGDVVDEPAAPAQQRLVLEAFDAGADQGGQGRSLSVFIPRSSRASASCCAAYTKDVDGRDKPGHDADGVCWMPAFAGMTPVAEQPLLLYLVMASLAFFTTS